MARPTPRVFAGASQSPIPLFGPFAIPDGGSDAVHFHVAGEFNVSNVSLTISGLRHSYAQDLVFTLSNPAGRVAYLVNRACGSALVGTTDDPTTAGSTGEMFTFTDAAAAPIASACSTAVRGGNYKPATAVPGAPEAGSMAALVGGSGAGTWSLTLADAAVKDLGFFDDAALTLTPADGSPPMQYDVQLTYAVTVLPVTGALFSAPNASVVVGATYTGRQVYYTPAAGAADGGTDTFTYRVSFACLPSVTTAVAVVISNAQMPFNGHYAARPTTRGVVQPASGASVSRTRFVPLHLATPIDPVCVMLVPPGANDSIPFKVPDVFTVTTVVLSLPDVCHTDAARFDVSLVAPPAAGAASVSLLNSNCAGFRFGDYSSYLGTCLGVPLTFDDVAVASLEGTCSGSTIGDPPDRSVTLPGGIYKPTVGVAASVTPGSMADLVGTRAKGTWRLRVNNRGSKPANFSCPVLLLTDTGGQVHSYQPVMSVVLRSVPARGTLFPESAVAAGATLARRGRYAHRWRASASSLAHPLAAQVNDTFSPLRLYYVAGPGMKGGDTDSFSYGYLYGGTATVANGSQAIRIYDPLPPSNLLKQVAALLFLLLLLLLCCCCVATCVHRRRRQREGQDKDTLCAVCGLPLLAPPKKRSEQDVVVDYMEPTAYCRCRAPLAQPPARARKGATKLPDTPLDADMLAVGAPLLALARAGAGAGAALWRPRNFLPRFAETDAAFEGSLDAVPAAVPHFAHPPAPEPHLRFTGLAFAGYETVTITKRLDAAPAGFAAADEEMEVEAAEMVEFGVDVVTTSVRGRIVEDSTVTRATLVAGRSTWSSGAIMPAAAAATAVAAAAAVVPAAHAAAHAPPPQLPCSFVPRFAETDAEFAGSLDGVPAAVPHFGHAPAPASYLLRDTSHDFATAVPVLARRQPAPVATAPLAVAAAAAGIMAAAAAEVDEQEEVVEEVIEYGVELVTHSVRGRIVEDSTVMRATLVDDTTGAVLASATAGSSRVVATSQARTTVQQRRGRAALP